MKARWQALSAKFAALQPREKVIVAAATVIGIVMGGHTFWVEPAQLRLTALQKKLAKDKSEIKTNQAQVSSLKAQLKDPDAPNKAALSEAEKRMSAAEREIHTFDNTLVPPQRVPQLLQSLFARHRGLELVSLQTLPPQPLLAPAAKAAGDAKPEPKAPDGKAPPAPVAKSGMLLKHGIEIKMAGNYLDLLAYVSDLERLPQKLLWESMSLDVKTYPKSELKLTVYTLSLDSIWLVV